MKETLQTLLSTLQDSARIAADTTADAAYGIHKKAEQLIHASRQSIRVADLRAQVDEEFRQLGQMIYATHTGDPTDSDALLEKLRSVDALRAQIAQLLPESEQPLTCPVCAASVRSEDVFCRSCGARLPRNP